VKYAKIAEFSALREQAGLTIDETAELTGTTTRTIYRWENGESKPNRLAVNILRDIVEDYRTKNNEKSNFTFIDLFAGIGGMRIAFESIGGECVYTSEWDKHAVKTYLTNFPTTHQIDGDITKVNPEDIPKHDVLVAGFPCQPFSIAGVSKKMLLENLMDFVTKLKELFSSKSQRYLNIINQMPFY
jgi:DNA (cytosine-5)-methyltransferase 1